MISTDVATTHHENSLTANDRPIKIGLSSNAASRSFQLWLHRTAHSQRRSVQRSTAPNFKMKSAKVRHISTIVEREIHTRRDVRVLTCPVAVLPPPFFSCATGPLQQRGRSCLGALLDYTLRTRVEHKLSASHNDSVNSRRNPSRFTPHPLNERAKRPHLSRRPLVFDPKSLGVCWNATLARGRARISPSSRRSPNGARYKARQARSAFPKASRSPRCNCASGRPSRISRPSTEARRSSW